ncbi:amidohydrolase family protein, partial [Spongiactinospora gelatinilytica]|uniref:amidohydrolase family protein n=1 Tax=Spongiactinospora gelatinilytica TaxID=2666298 RepID=UPI0022791EA6
MAERGQTPIATAARTGLLGPSTIIAHATKATADDIRLIREPGATIAHNPQSNLKLGSGIAPVRSFLDAGVPVAIGTDGPAADDSLDLLRDLRLAVSLQRGITERADHGTPATPSPPSRRTARRASASPPRPSLPATPPTWSSSTPPQPAPTPS